MAGFSLWALCLPPVTHSDPTEKEGVSYRMVTAGAGVGLGGGGGEEGRMAKRDGAKRKKDSWTWTSVWGLLGGGEYKGTTW